MIMNSRLSTQRSLFKRDKVKFTIRFKEGITTFPLRNELMTKIGRGHEEVGV